MYMFLVGYKHVERAPSLEAIFFDEARARELCKKLRDDDPIKEDRFRIARVEANNPIEVCGLDWISDDEEFYEDDRYSASAIGQGLVYGPMTHLQYQFALKHIPLGEIAEFLRSHPCAKENVMAFLSDHDG